MSVVAATQNVTTTLDLREPFGQVRQSLNETTLTGLASGSLTNTYGTSTYNQTLSFHETNASGDNPLQDFAVNYRENAGNVISDYLVIPSQKPFFDWQLNLSNLNSSAVEYATGKYRLSDLEGLELPLLGANYTIAFASLQNTSGLPLDLSLIRSKAILDNLSLSETNLYSINGIEYNVKLVALNSSTPDEAEFMVNGQVTPMLSPGEHDLFTGNISLVVRDANATAGTAEFAIGLDNVILSDSASNDSLYTSGGVEVNNQNISDADLLLKTTIASGTPVAPTEISLDSIGYTLVMNDASAADAYVPAGSGIRSIMRYPESLLSPDFDIKYEGLTTPAHADISLNASGTGQYLLTFTNVRNENITVPYLNDSDGSLRFGNATGNFIFVEAQSNTSYNIDENDFFIVTNTPWDNGSATEALRYDSINTTLQIVYFTDLSDGSSHAVVYYLNTPNSTANGTLGIGGHAFDVYVNNTNSSSGAHMLAIDQNGDGTFTGAQIGVTVLGGGMLNLTTNFTNGSVQIYNTASATNNLSLIVGHSLNISSGNWYLGNGTPVTPAVLKVGMSLTTLATLFSTPSTDGVLSWRVFNQSGNVSLETNSNDYTGPRENSSNIYSEYQFTNNVSNSTYYYSMTDYGARVTETIGSPNLLTIAYPIAQRNASVLVSMPRSTPITATNDGTISATSDNISSSSFGFNLSLSNDTVSVNYSITNSSGTVWTNGTLNSSQLSSDSWIIRKSYDGIFLPVGNWTLEINYSNGTTLKNSTTNFTSRPAIRTSLVGSGSKSATIGGSAISFTFNITAKAGGSKIKAYINLSGGGDTFDTSYASLSNGTTSVNVSGSADYSGSGNVTIPVISSSYVPSYVVMNLTGSGTVRQRSVTLSLTPYTGLVATTYSGSYGFGIFN